MKIENPNKLLTNEKEVSWGVEMIRKTIQSVPKKRRKTFLQGKIQMWKGIELKMVTFV
jgi:hypothetical protein